MKAAHSKNFHDIALPLGLAFFLIILYLVFPNDAMHTPIDTIKNCILFILGSIPALLYLSCNDTFKIFSLNSWHKRPLLLIYVGYIGSIILSVYFMDGAQAAEGWAYLSRILLFSLWLNVFLRVSAKQWETIFFISLLTMAIIAIYTLYMYTGIENHGILFPIGHISYFSDICAIHIFIAIYLAHNLTNKVARLSALFLVMPLFIALWQSGTRSSLLGFITAIVFTGFVYSRFKKTHTIPLKRMAIFASLISISFIVICVTNSFRKDSVLSRFDALINHEKSLSDLSPKRMDGYLETLQMIKVKPYTGWGSGSFRFVYPSFDKPPIKLQSSYVWYIHPHNEILRQLVENGPLGLFFWLLFYGVIFTTGFKKLYFAKNLSPLPLLGMCIFISSFVSWQFSTTFDHPICQLLTVIGISLILKEDHKKTTSTLYKPSIILKSSYFFGLIISIIIQLAIFSSDFYTYKSYYSFDPSDKLNYAKKAYNEYFPTYLSHYVYTMELQAHPESPQYQAVTSSFIKHYKYTSQSHYLRAQVAFNHSDLKSALFHAKKAHQIHQRSRQYKSLLNLIKAKRASKTH